MSRNQPNYRPINPAGAGSRVVPDADRNRYAQSFVEIAVEFNAAIEQARRRLAPMCTAVQRCRSAKELPGLVGVFVASALQQRTPIESLLSQPEQLENLLAACLLDEQCVPPMRQATRLVIQATRDNVLIQPNTLWRRARPAMRDEPLMDLADELELFWKNAVVSLLKEAWPERFSRADDSVWSTAEDWVVACHVLADLVQPTKGGRPPSPVEGRAPRSAEGEGPPGEDRGFVLSPDDRRILQALARAGTTRFQPDLAAHTQLTRGTISRRLQQLRLAGLTDRPRGQRGGEAITAAGRAALSSPVDKRGR